MKEKPEAQEWYFFKAGSDAGFKAGPFSWDRLLSQAQGGTLEPTDVVWDPNSGWKTAAQVPGLFPASTAPTMASTHLDTQPPYESGTAHRGSRVYWLTALAALVVVGVGLGAYFGFFHDNADEPVATTVVAPVTTAQSPGTTLSTATTLATATTVTPTSTVGVTPVAYLDRGDSHTQIVLHVGERVRVDLQPWLGDNVKTVRWTYLPGVVRETDSGSQLVGSAVSACWLELEAVATGRATVRAVYVYPNGTSSSKWVAYLIVVD